MASETSFMTLFKTLDAAFSLHLLIDPMSESKVGSTLDI